MKLKKAMAAILASVTILGTGVVPAMAADVPELSQAQLRQLAALNVEALADEEAATTPQAFSFADMADGQVGINGQAYKVDLSENSMANDSLVGGSRMTKSSKGYEFVIKVEQFLLEGLTAEPEEVTVTYYDANGDLATVTVQPQKTNETSVGMAQYNVIFTLPLDAQGMKPDGAAAGHTNMIKVAMRTSLSDSLIGQLFPSMVTPTFFYGFDVE